MNNALFDDDQDEFLAIIDQLDLELEANKSTTMKPSTSLVPSRRRKPKDNGPSGSHLNCLKTFFGHQQFRPRQWDIIRSIIEDKADNCAVMSTGYGKSLCFQFPSVYLNGITMVISPLISLMQDQVYALRKVGISACFLGSAQEDKTVADRAINGTYRIVYVCPEYITNRPTYLSKFADKLTMIAIDESHCVSQWGHDFRPTYYQLGMLRTILPNVPILAVTATATKLVREDICKTLKLHKPNMIITDFDRPNLEFIVRQKSYKNHLHDLLPIVSTNSKHGGCIIIYCLKRDHTEDIAKDLNKCGYNCRFYHAGMMLDLRKKVLEEFIHGQVKIIVATLAFGMGIDKSDVRYVIHYGIPKDIEGYYQEVGRAGRDGIPSKCILFYHENDFGIHSFYRKQSKSVAMKEIMQQNSDKMRRYVYSNECRRLQILKHFDDPKSDTLRPKKNCCDNCKQILLNLHTFHSVLCFTTRTRNQVKIDREKITLSGNSEKHEISINDVRRIFLLPNQSNQLMYLVISLNTSLRRGQTLHNHLIFEFSGDRYEKTNCNVNELSSLTSSSTNDKTVQKYKNEEYITGHIYDVMAKILIIASKNRLKVSLATIKPITCCYKTTTGLLYLMESEFIYLTNTPIHIRFEGIVSIEFLRCGLLTKYFDLVVVEAGFLSTPHKFQNIARYNHDHLFKLICKQNITIITNYNHSQFLENNLFMQPDVCLEEIDCEYESDEQSSTIESESEVESDENYYTPDDDCFGSTDESECESQKAPSTAYIIWLHELIDKMKKASPDITYTEIFKSLDKSWNERSKSIYQKKAFVDLIRYKNQQKGLKPCKNYKRILDGSDSDSDDENLNHSDLDDMNNNNVKKRRTV